MTDLPIARCPSCAAEVSPTDSFCESCGTTLSPLAVAAVGSDSSPRRPCAQCGGAVGDDGYCSTCGAKAASPRDHWSEQPAPWLAGVCDKGIVHTRNEDAMALAGIGSTGAVIVVCDGVTSAPDSDQASLAAARIACASVAGAGAPRAAADSAAPVPVQRAEGDDAAFYRTMLQLAAQQANGAAVAVARTLGDPAEAPSCTFVAAVVVPLDEGTAGRPKAIVAAWCGDSRAYWFPDDGDDRQLTVDHSLGTEMIAAGRTRDEAEADPAFHTITRWLGADSANPTSEIVTCPVAADGWLLVCSDGLWNYASTPAAMRAALQRAVAAVTEIGGPAAARDPLKLADELVRFANEQGGHDNITAVLARVADRP